VASPFPGMDPYLESPALWPGFQQQFVTCLYQLLLPNLADRYNPRPVRRTYHTEIVLFTSIIREEHVESFVEVRRRTDSRLVTLIDVVSPANKTTAEGRAAYLAQRRLAQNAGANLVEIDLVLQGKPTLDFPRDGLDCDYTVTVARADRPDRYDVYPITLREKLKKVKLPLGPEDGDRPLDLQNVFARCYDQSGYAKQIDYAADLPVPVPEDTRKWVDALLRQLKLRK
jgi:Protein of unknown function (DUF4058)